MIEAVFFDVDDTLVDFDAAARAAFLTVFGESADYASWIALSREWYPRHPAEMSWERMRVSRTAAFLESLGLSDDPARTEAHRMDLMIESFALFPDVADCLRTLRSGDRRLGVITNSESLYQRGKLRAVGLADAFDAVVISGEVGVSKPDRAIFGHACAQVAVDPARALHIGDRLDIDALGAADAGLRGIWLDRHRLGEPARVPVVHSLAELPSLVV